MIERKRNFSGALFYRFLILSKSLPPPQSTYLPKALLLPSLESWPFNLDLQRETGTFSLYVLWKQSQLINVQGPESTHTNCEVFLSLSSSITITMNSGVTGHWAVNSKLRVWPLGLKKSKHKRKWTEEFFWVCPMSPACSTWWLQY